MSLGTGSSCPYLLPLPKAHSPNLSLDVGKRCKGGLEGLPHPSIPFPVTSVCPGTHWMLILTSGRVRKMLLRLSIIRMVRHCFGVGLAGLCGEGGQMCFHIWLLLNESESNASSRSIATFGPVRISNLKQLYTELLGLQQITKIVGQHRN